MGVREQVTRGAAGQLAHPSGIIGRVVARMTNRGNNGVIRGGRGAGRGPGRRDLAAIEPERRAADFGSGGGLGLRLLLERVGPFGRVTGGGLGLRLLLERVGPFGRVTCIDAGDPTLWPGRTGISGSDHPRPAEGDGRLAPGVAAAGCLDRCRDHREHAASTVNKVYFVQDIDVLSAELRRALRPGGLVVAIGDGQAMARLPFTRYGFTLRAAADVRSALESAGFTGVEDQRVGTGPGAAHRLLAPA